MDSKNSGNSFGSVILIVVVSLIGGAFLYQREGGKIFGPGGVVAPPAPPRVNGLDAKFDAGVFSHDLQLTNHSSDLTEADLTITFYQEDGQKPVVKQFWSKWAYLEVKTINVPSHRYQKVTLSGTACQRFEKRTVDESWTWTWGSK